MWYAENIALDEEEHYKFVRDMVEYNSMFVNADGVKSIRNSRDSSSSVSSDFNPEDEISKIKSDPLVNAIKERYKSGNKADRFGDKEHNGLKISDIIKIT